jgi:hypothetical protein
VPGTSPAAGALELTGNSLSCDCQLSTDPASNATISPTTTTPGSAKRSILTAKLPRELCCCPRSCRGFAAAIGRVATL